MKYASTAITGGIERVVVVMDLNLVPLFDPENPHPQTYVVEDDVQIGWIRDSTGKFIAPPPADQPKTTGTKDA